MRDTIIIIFSAVVLIVSLMAFALMRLTVGDTTRRGEAQRAATAAVSHLQVQSLRIERWAQQQADSETLRDPFTRAISKARAGAATKAADKVYEASKKKGAPFGSRKANLILVVDAQGIALGRNHSTSLMRGNNLAPKHPQMFKALANGTTGSAIWPEKHQLVSYAPIRDESGKVVGGLVVGTQFNNGRLDSTSQATSGVSLVAAVRDGSGKIGVIATTSTVPINAQRAAQSAQAVFNSTTASALSGLGENLDAAAIPLDGYGQDAVIVALVPQKDVASFRSLLLAILGAAAVGWMLTLVAAHLMDNYISQPVSDLEEGLLAVINGETDLRFELEHEVLGGLVFRVNSLLNELLGVQEDNTDEEGRPSVAPSSSSFSAALTVDERMVSLSFDDVENAAELRDEAPEDYYKRIYDEYIAIKRRMGDPTGHIRFAAFSNRIKALEQQLSGRHGKPFRYKIEAKGREVVLMAVPLA